MHGVFDFHRVQEHMIYVFARLCTPAPPAVFKHGVFCIGELQMCVDMWESMNYLEHAMVHGQL